ncbi:P-loop NTPase family protein [Actinomadura soli]|uniref:hypothetical protein n=1 Tax=Actinomadura soli TaxID=2508997 RepID=UPI0026966E41|nr:hypothetical protein [Actinomadura soli]
MAAGCVAITAYQPRAAAHLASVLAATVPPDAYEGVVRVSAQETAGLSIEALREHILVNPYDGEIFAGTLRTNLDPSGTGRMIAEAVEASMLTDVVAPHRDGLDHPVRDRGEPVRRTAATAVPGPCPRR